MSRVSPCVEWAVEGDIPETCDTTAIAPATMTAALTLASDVMFNLTRRRWPGLCTDTFRPFSNQCCYVQHDPNDWAVYHGAVKLPAIDVRAISSVKLDGAVVDPTWYRLRKNYLMPRRLADGTIPLVLPCWQDLYADDTADNTFEITYTHGADPPDAGVTVCALLAYEFALAWTPACAGSCRLPQRVTTVTRAGTTFAILDPLTVFEKGMVGIPDIDVWIQSVNHGESRQRAFVGRPGMSSGVSRD